VKPRVFIAVPLAEQYVALIRERCDVTAYAGEGRISRDELCAALADAEGVLATPQIPFPADVLDAAPGLRVICNIGVGYDNVDLAHAAARGIVVANTPGVLSDAVADLVLAIMIAVARRLPESARIVREGRWGTPIPLGADLRSKTLALIGFGRIGREVAARALACKMRVVFFDARPDIAAMPDVERVASLDEALARADFVSLHVDLNETTRRFIGAREFALMKPEAFFINAARGGVVDQQALYAALAGDRIAGAALDVLETEPPDPADPLLQLDNAYIVPHLGSATVETRLAMTELAVRNLIACMHGDPCACIVTAATPGDARRQSTGDRGHR
jgi:glyoxylate reductase